MWVAMGQCYEHEQLNMAAHAIQCYERAHQAGDREGKRCPALRTAVLGSFMDDGSAALS